MQQVHKNLYPSHGRLIPISCGFEECNKRSKVAIKSSLKLIPLSLEYPPQAFRLRQVFETRFLWGAIAQPISVVIIKRIKLLMVYKLRLETMPISLGKETGQVTINQWRIQEK